MSFIALNNSFCKFRRNTIDRLNSRQGCRKRRPSESQTLFFLQRNFDDLRRGEKSQRDAGCADAVGGNNRCRFIVRVMLDVNASGKVRSIAKHADRGVESEKRYLSAVRMSR